MNDYRILMMKKIVDDDVLLWRRQVIKNNGAVLPVITGSEIFKLEAPILPTFHVYLGSSSLSPSLPPPSTKTNLD